MTAQFYRQNALPDPNLTRRDPNLTQPRATLQWQVPVGKNVHRAGGACCVPPARWLFLLSLQCRAWLCQVRVQAHQVRVRQCTLSVKLRCHCQSRQVRYPRVRLRGGLGTVNGEQWASVREHVNNVHGQPDPDPRLSNKYPKGVTEVSWLAGSEEKVGRNSTLWSARTIKQVLKQIQP